MLIQDIKIEPDLVMAPIASFTDTTFRKKVKDIGGCGLIFSEMISVEALTRGCKKTLKMLTFSETERPIAIQISGCNVMRMVEGAKIIEGKGADIIDINMGCPARKVVKTGAGSALMNNRVLASEIIEKVRQAVSIPVTVKTRAGWEKGDRKGVDMAIAAQEAGASAITMHPRYRYDSYKDQADWSLIGEVKSSVRILVIGNGDVKEAKDAIRMKSETGCDAVMIGRAAVRNPWIFKQTVDLRKGEEPFLATLDDKKQFAREHFHLLLEHENEKIALHRMKSFAGWYFKGIPGGINFRRRLNSVRTPSEFLNSALDYL
jgi:tRNA-dihydrouridine synthase B